MSGGQLHLKRRGKREEEIGGRVGHLGGRERKVSGENYVEDFVRIFLAKKPFTCPSDAMAWFHMHSSTNIPSSLVLMVADAEPVVVTATMTYVKSAKTE